MFVPGEFFRDESLESHEGSPVQADVLLLQAPSSLTTLTSIKKQMFQYVRTNQWNRVESTWKAAFGDPSSSGSENDPPALIPDFESCEWLIRSYGERIGKSQDAEALFEKMKSMVSESRSETSSQASQASAGRIPPKLMTATAYTSLMMSLTRDERLTRMLEVFTEMKSVDRLVWKDPDVRRASQALHASHLKPQDFIDAVSPCIAAWKSFVQSSTKNSKVSSAELARLSRALELEALGYAVAKSVAHYDFAAAAKYADPIIKDSNAVLFTKTIWHIARWYILKGQFSEARKFINHSTLRDKPARSQGTAKMGSHLAPRLAILLLELPLLEAKDKTKTAEALLPQFYALFDSYAANDAHAVAHFMVKTLYRYRLYDDLFAVVAYVDRALSSSISLTAIFNLKLRAHVALDQPEEALTMLSRMQDGPLHAPNPQTSTHLISMAARLHGARAAHDLLMSVIDSVGIPRGTAFKAVVKAYCQESKVEDALAVLDLMDAKGLTVIWDDYEPVMQLYERLHLLGKQFSLFNWLLTQRLSHQPPSPALTANLILSSIGQQYMNVAKSVAKGVEKHHIPLSFPLVSALLVLHNLLGNKAEIAKLAAFCETKMSASGGESAEQRSKYGALAIRSYGYLHDHVNVDSVYKRLKEDNLHQNILVLNVALESWAKGPKKPFCRKLLSSNDLLVQEFGPAVAEKAARHPQTASIRIKLLPKTDEHYNQTMKEWQEIVAAELNRREAAKQAKIEVTRSATSESSDETAASATSILMDDEELKALGTPDLETHVSPLNFKAEIESSKVSDENLESTSEGVEKQEADIEETSAADPTQRVYPRPSSSLALEVLRMASTRMETSPKDSLQVIREMRKLGIPTTMTQHTIHAQVLIQNGHHFALNALLESIYAAHFNMSRNFYLLLFSDLSKLRRPTEVRHRLALTILRFMEKAKGDRSPVPNAEIWNAYMMCVAPSEIGIALADFVNGGHTITAETMDSITRQQIICVAPLFVAVHDVFVLFAGFESRYGIYPSVEALMTLYSGCMRSIVPSVYKQKFFLLLKHLNGQSEDTSKLTWDAATLEYVKKETSKIVAGDKKRRQEFSRAKTSSIENSYSNRAQLIEELISIQFPKTQDWMVFRKPLAREVVIADAETSCEPIALNLGTTPLPKRKPIQVEEEKVEEVVAPAPAQAVIKEDAQQLKKRELLTKALLLTKGFKNPDKRKETAKLLLTALRKFKTQL